MIYCSEQNDFEVKVQFKHEEKCQVSKVFQGNYLQEFLFEDVKDKFTLWIGIGKEPLTINQVIEVVAAAVKHIRKYEITSFSFAIENLITTLGIGCIEKIVQGICLGLYEPFQNLNLDQYDIGLCGIGQDLEKAKDYIKRGLHIGEGICFARTLVNCPGNQLKPMDMARTIKDYLKDTKVEVQVYEVEQLQSMGMEGLCSIGNSSANPPCLLVMRYLGDPNSNEKMGLVGKGVTCDTGGYCLKPASSMAGIKGDMAGGAAVFGAIYALAKNEAAQNVVGIIPMCENRISNHSLLPGDVISSYSNKTIEVLNTDAEGRIILADAVSYGVKEEGVTKLLDIATLTGAVVSMLGFSIAGVISDHNEFFNTFEKAYQHSGEQYLRLPFYQEHLEMIKSKVADVKNLGESYCGTITAGLFIREFVGGTPWIHVDIAGTAWVDSPIWKYQTKGATGAGVSTLYYLCEEN